MAIYPPYVISLSVHGEELRQKRWHQDLLRDAAETDNVEMMALFIAAGADINAGRDDLSPEGVISDAASEGAINAVRWL